MPRLARAARAPTAADRRCEPAPSGFPVRGTRRRVDPALRDTGSAWRERRPPTPNHVLRANILDAPFPEGISRASARWRPSAAVGSSRRRAVPLPSAPRRRPVATSATGECGTRRMSRQLVHAWPRESPAVHASSCRRSCDRKIRRRRILLRFGRSGQRKSTAVTLRLCRAAIGELGASEAVGPSA